MTGVIKFYNNVFCVILNQGDNIELLSDKYPQT